MRSPVVVASTWSASDADHIAALLRSEGIEAFVTTNFDRTTYGGGFGGASVLVDAERRLEAELEIVRIEQHATEDGPHDDGPPGSGTAHRSPWVRVIGWAAIGALAVGAVVPPATVIWQRLFG